MAEHLHFGEAAEHLRLAQPQVSRRIAQLEESLDVTLLERNSRVVKLTDVGKAFLPEAIAVLRSVETARRHAVERARGKNGLLTLSVNDAAMIGSVTPILNLFHRRYPDVHLAFSTDGHSSAGQLELLSEGAVDVVFTHPPASRSVEHFEQVVLVNDPLVAVMAENHPLARVGALSLNELARDPWVMFPRENDPPIYDRIMRLCQSAGFTPRIVYETGHMLTRLGLIASGFGVHLVHSAWRSMPYPGVAYVSVEPTERVALSCFWQRSNNSQLVANLVAIVRAHAI